VLKLFVQFWQPHAAAQTQSVQSNQYSYLIMMINLWSRIVDTIWSLFTSIL
jgi:hypothetical protein